MALCCCAQPLSPLTGPYFTRLILQPPLSPFPVLSGVRLPSSHRWFHRPVAAAAAAAAASLLSRSSWLTWPRARQLHDPSLVTGWMLRFLSSFTCKDDQGWGCLLHCANSSWGIAAFDWVCVNRNIRVSGNTRVQLELQDNVWSYFWRPSLTNILLEMAKESDISETYVQYTWSYSIHLTSPPTDFNCRVQNIPWPEAVL